MAQAKFHSSFPWTIHRDRGGSPRKWQRWYEAWLVITGRYTFWHAWHDGKHAGSTAEYERVVRNGGDLTPLLCAAVNTLCPGDMTEERSREKRAAIWANYTAARTARSDRAA